jgi:predicted AlkP superfamily phosphohydrolase/phosphomutase
VKGSDFNKVMVIGVDGLDPGVTENLMAGGKLKALAALRDKGCYRRLATSNPSQSPVAWSSIATGGNPGCHGIFDFLTRSPDTYLPELTVFRANPLNILEQRGSMFLKVRRGRAFWDLTSEARIPTQVIKWPLTLPPEKVYGHMLSGLGVPDLKTTLGRYSFYTTRQVCREAGKKGDFITLTRKGDAADTIIHGPHNLNVPLRIVAWPKDAQLTLTIANKDYRLKQGEWSDWIPIAFAISFLNHISGMCRFYPCSVNPELDLYMSPLHVYPEKPAFPISHPDGYAASLFRDLGAYHTLGIPEDTNALIDGSLDEDAFLRSCDDVMKEREKLFWHEIKQFKEGLFAFVFDTTDRIQHVFWPAGEEGFSKKHSRVIEEYYMRIDAIIEKVLEAIDDQTLLILLSDHGFTSFRRAVHLNSWLVEKGLMVLKSRSDNHSLFRNVAWEKTIAYAVGFSSIYLNRYGRELKGIVKDEEGVRLKQQIALALKELRDPETGGHIIKDIYASEAIYQGPCMGQAPDLVVGFNNGYRCSWQSALGETPSLVVEDNRELWKGDHLLDPSLVPGVLFMNQQTGCLNPGLLDIAPTVAKAFNLPVKGIMEGVSLL